KVTGNYVDAVSAAALQMKKVADNEKAEEAERTLRIYRSRDEGLRNCLPSSFATEFPCPKFLPGRGRGERPSRNSTGSGGAAGGDAVDTTGGSLRGGRTSTAVDLASDLGDSEDDEEYPFYRYNKLRAPAILNDRKVKGINGLFAREVSEGLQCWDNVTIDEEDLQAATGATDDELEKFLNGWTGDELPPDMAIALMTGTVYNFSETGKDMEGRFKSMWPNKKWSDFKIKGWRLQAVHSICKYYGASFKNLRSQTTPAAVKLYTKGWQGSQLGQGEVDFLNHTLAMMLLCGEDYEPPAREEPGEGTSDDDTSILGKGKGRRTSKSGRKTREPKLKVKEDEIT
ncbi:unnamed protein product, partial [Ectocarpus sp. 4 AP-2014]